MVIETLWILWRREELSLELKGFFRVLRSGSNLSNKNQSTEVLAKGKGYNQWRNDIKLMKALRVVVAQGF